MARVRRSFVAQRVMQALGHGILFHGPTVWQERNKHNLHQDFMDEVPGYSHNARMREALLGISLAADEPVRVMMEKSYQALIRHGWVGVEEEVLLSAWFADLDTHGIRFPAI